MTSFDLTNQFLIAMPSMADPNFSKTVTYVCAHNDDGAMGIVINRLTEIGLGEVFAQMKIDGGDRSANAQHVYQGGPVHRDRGFIIHYPAIDWDSTIRVTNELAVSTSRDILEAISSGAGPDETLIALGYAGWGAGQLEQEMGQNAWLSGPATMEIIFHTPPERRWERAAAAMGVDLGSLSNDVGHA
ncbi:MAG TPA: YqgE/AlgH family protein [Gammaproteobacteria bacterium]|jgi:putative transcriptional regulator|nr:YqgE/AlgH family protein [Gammaproteobacteria bacterium]